MGVERTDSGVSRRQALRASLTAASALAATQTVATPARAGTEVAHAGADSGISAVVPGPRGQFARNVEVVGYTDMDHRPAFKLAIRRVGDRWYLYTGHFWHSGWSVVDVTDLRRPEVVAFVPGPEDTWTLQVDLHGDIMVTALEQIFPNFGGDPEASFEEGIYI
ncbi:hypothetical protein [Nonomuraea sp. B5E05]|uniref:hypothetical protein n=1 Tax=Nonomuraea sp. B5E05 TaxID=3153569 RepID=UPI003261B122